MALNKPFTDSHSRGTKQPCWRARDALGWDKQSKLPFYMAGAPSIQPKLSKIWKQRQWCRNFRKSFQKFWKLLISEMHANHSTENSGNSGSKVEWKGNFREKAFSKIWVYLARFSSGLEILENAVPFATGSWTFWLNGKGPWCTCIHGCFVPWLTAKGLLARTNAI